MKEPEKKFWNNSQTIAEFFNYPKDEYWNKILLRHRDVEKVLDLGCGGGRNTQMLIELGFDTYACDLYQGMVQATKKRLKKKSKIIQADMKNLPFVDGSFDVVLANGVYHNAKSTEEFYTSIKETSRILKDGGVLLVNLFTSNNWDKKSLSKKKGVVFQTKNGMKMVLFTANKLMEIFQSFEFVLVDEIQQYIRHLKVGKRSVFKTVLKKVNNVRFNFPQKPRNQKIINNKLRECLKEIPDLEDNSEIQRFGFAMTSPHPISVETITKFISKNNNNVGVHTLDNTNLTGTRKLEQEAIGWLASLLGDKIADGYITSGGTEGNLIGIWIGREKVRCKGCKKITLIVSPLTHTSLIKAARILDLEIKIINLNRSGSLDIDELLQNLRNLKSSEGVILGLTAGYYSTGISDNIPIICKRLDKLKNKDNIYVHVDAAFGGFVYPFTDPLFEYDFRNKLINSMTIDPHKMGLMPYSCGVFLCRKGLLQYIQVENMHAGVTDTTLIGSRSGAVAAALWATIASLGYSGYKKIVDNCLEKKEYLIKELMRLDRSILLKSASNINNFAVSFSIFEDGLLPKNIEKKYRLVPNTLSINNSKVNTKNFYHFYIMPHVSKQSIDRFLEDLQKIT